MKYNVFSNYSMEGINQSVINMSKTKHIFDLKILLREFVRNTDCSTGKLLGSDLMKVVYMEPDSELEVVPFLAHGLEVAVLNSGILPMSQVEKMK